MACEQPKGLKIDLSLANTVRLGATIKGLKAKAIGDEADTPDGRQVVRHAPRVAPVVARAPSVRPTPP